MKPKIAVDVDGVLADVYSPIFQILGLPYTWEDVKKWDFFADLQVDKQAFWDAYKKLWSEKFHLIPLIEEDASAIIRKLRRCFEVHIMSCRFRTTFIGTLMWLQQYNIEYDGLVFLPPSADKTKYLDNYLVLVDDNPSYSHHEKVILYDRPWNRGVSGLRRIRSLRELLKIVDAIAKSPPQRGCSRGAPP
jgi:5'(3')-deoxyribonucleotidase